jgi:hypothetical protein
MDTLYLVFKDQFQIVLDCLTDDKLSPQANGDSTLWNLLCQARLSVRKMLFLSNKKAAFLKAILQRKAAPLCA